MNPLQYLNSLPFMRPALMVVFGVATLVHAYCPPQYVHVLQFADLALKLATLAGIGSVGMSNSGLSPTPAAQTAAPVVPPVPPVAP